MERRGLSRGTVVPVNDPILRAFRDGVGHINLNQKSGQMLHWQMLGATTRRKADLTMKNPLRLAIVEATSKGRGLFHYWRTFRAIWRIFKVCQLFPKPTRENCSYHNTFILLDIRDWFLGHFNWEPARPMFQSAFNMFINLYEHAGEYTDWFDVLVEKLVETYNTGNWEKRRSGRPIPRYWREEI